MKRVAIVVLLALVTAFVSGVRETSWAQAPEQESSAEAHRKALRARLEKMPDNAVIRVERTTGPKIDGILEQIGTDAVTIVVPKGTDRTTIVIPYDEIRKVDELHGHTLRNVLIGFGIGVAVLVGVCAAAANSY